MQVLHSAYAVGAFVAPLIAREFISTKNEGTSNCTEIINTTSTTEGIGGCYNNISTNDTMASHSRFQDAYWISASLFFPPLLGFVFFAIRYDILRHRCLKKNPSLSSANTTTVAVNKGFEESDEENDHEEDKGMDELPSLVLHDNEEENSQTRPSHEDEVQNHKLNQSLIFKITVLSCLFIFMFVYVGLEVAYGNLIFTVAVTGPLQLSKLQGTVIQSLFWGTFAFTRIISIVLALFNVRSSIMICGNLFGSVLAATIMVFFTHNAVAIWLGSAVLGMSYASIYPTVMTWMSQTVEATGKATAVLSYLEEL